MDKYSSLHSATRKFWEAFCIFLRKVWWKPPMPTAVTLVNLFILTLTSFPSYFLCFFSFASWDHHPNKLPSINSLFQYLLLRECEVTPLRSSFQIIMTIVILEIWKFRKYVPESNGPHLKSWNMLSHFLRKRIPHWYPSYWVPCHLCRDLE